MDSKGLIQSLLETMRVFPWTSVGFGSGPKGVFDYPVLKRREQGVELLATRLYDNRVKYKRKRVRTGA